MGFYPATLYADLRGGEQNQGLRRPKTGLSGPFLGKAGAAKQCATDPD